MLRSLTVNDPDRWVMGATYTIEGEPMRLVKKQRDLRSDRPAVLTFESKSDAEVLASALGAARRATS